MELEEKTSLKLSQADFRNNGSVVLTDYLQNIGINKRYHNADPERILADNKLLSWIDHLHDNIISGKGLIISGPVGVGKTSILSFIASKNFEIKIFNRMRYNSTDEIVIVDSKQKFTCQFISTSKLFDLFFKTDFSLIEKYEKCDLLLLDDFGREYSSEYPAAKFEDFIETRNSNMKSTIVTTNLTPQQLKDYKYVRAVDRLRESEMLLIIINAESQRGKKYAAN